jgi:hypothetical protein
MTQPLEVTGNTVILTTILHVSSGWRRFDKRHSFEIQSALIPAAAPS